jgi:hypothetical protein
VLGSEVLSTKDCLPILLKDREVGGVKIVFTFVKAQRGLGARWCFGGGSRVAERMPLRPSAYETSHNVTPDELVEEGVALTDALYEQDQGWSKRRSDR